MAALFAALFTVYAVSPARWQTDSVWSIPLVASLLHEGDVDLDEYRAAAFLNGFGVVAVGNAVHSEFPIGASLAALPLVGALDALVHAAGPLAAQSEGLSQWSAGFHAVGAVDLGFFTGTEAMVAAFFAALAGVFVFLAARQLTAPWAAWLVTLLFALGTSVWSTASRVLWAHTPLLAITAATVFLLARGAMTWRTSLALGLLGAFGFVVRPTHAVTLLAVVVFLARRRDARLLGAHAAGLALVAIPFLVFSLHTFSSPLPPYYLASRLQPFGSTFLEALAGDLVSPGRGLFIFSPVLLLAFAAPWLLARNEAAERQLCLLAAGVIASHWVVIASFPHWWAGHSYGPRLFTDVLPWFAVPLAISSRRLAGGEQRRRWTVAWATLGLISVLIHARGATAWPAFEWNRQPQDVDAAPARVWNWADLQFLRGL